MKELEWLHDAAVETIEYASQPDGTKQLTLVVNCPPDLGLAEWEGRRLTIRAEDVFLVRFTAFGGTVGTEGIDSWNQGLSPETSQEVARLGVLVPPLRYQVTMNAGSSFELICRAIRVAVD